MKNLNAAYMARKQFKGMKMNKGGMSCYNEGGEVISSAEKLKKALSEPSGYDQLSDEEKSYMPSKDIAKAIMAKKMANGGMVEDMMDVEEADPLESELHFDNHLMEDGEHEVEGMGDKEKLMKKGMLNKIISSLRMKHMGG